MKKLIFLVLLLAVFKASGQSTDNLKQYPVKKSTGNIAFTKEFSRIANAYAHNFAELKSDDRLVTISDTVYHVKLNFKEKHDVSLTCEKDDINLTITFSPGAEALNKLFNEITNALPAGFVYTLEYDAEAKQSNYTFFAKHGAKAIGKDYPDKIYLIMDKNNAVLTFLKYR